MLSFPAAVAAIHGLEKRGWRLGLDRMVEVVRLAGLAGAVGPSAPSFIHVAGTNGKGTTTAFLQSLMVEQGFRTGAFFSPFVYNIRERVQFGREMISEEDFARLTTELLAATESMEGTALEGISEFELKAALGFAYWKEQACDWVALEVGLGGRLDATNVVQSKANIITSIGWDHMAILGNTLEKIAAEKAGILKPGVPVVVGHMDPGPMKVIIECAQEIESPVWRLGHEVLVTADSVETPGAVYRGLKPRLQGSKVRENMALAVAAMEAAGAIKDPARVAVGVELATLPGRYETRMRHGQRFILDGAHNVDSGRVLADSLRADGIEDAILITNMLTGHDPEPFYEALRPFVGRIIVCPIDFPRARTVAETGETLRAMGFETEEASSPLDAILRAQADLGRTVVVSGSFYLVGEIGRVF
jgi:dihydrofolate synthase/folylpolyglutamate synthase